jgi:hypothetical protein
MPSLQRNLTLLEKLKEQIIETELDIDADELQELLDGVPDKDMATPKELLPLILDKRDDAKAFVDAIKKKKVALNERQKRYEAQETLWTKLLLRSMKLLNEAKVVLPQATVTVRKPSASVHIVDEGLIPGDYVALERKILKDEIKKHLMQKDATPIEGAELRYGEETVTVKGN